MCERCREELVPAINAILSKHHGSHERASHAQRAAAIETLLREIAATIALRLYGARMAAEIAIASLTRACRESGTGHGLYVHIKGPTKRDDTERIS